MFLDPGKPCDIYGPQREGPENGSKISNFDVVKVPAKIFFVVKFQILL